MSVSLAASVRVTTKQSTVYRQCTGCNELAALPRDESRCHGCRTPAPPRPGGRRPRRRPSTSTPKDPR